MWSRLRSISFVLYLLLLIGRGTVYAQNTRFSQYHFTPTLTNPSWVALKSEAFALVNFRQQRIDANQSITSPMATLVMPIFKTHRDERQRIAGLGLSVLNETTGQNNFFRTTSVLAGMAYNLPVSDISFLSFGLQGGYIQRSIDAGNVTTEALYLNGFDPTLVSEPLSNYRDAFPIVNSGMTFYSQDPNQEIPFRIGLSIYNLNRPDVSFFDQVTRMPMSMQVTGELRIYQNQHWSIYPNVRWWERTKVNQLTAGTRFEYLLLGNPDAKLIGQGHLAINTWYHFNQIATVGFEIEQPSFILGLSYDFPIGNNLTQPNSTIELSFAWHKKYDTHKKKKRRRRKVKKHKKGHDDHNIDDETKNDNQNIDDNDIGNDSENIDGDNQNKDTNDIENGNNKKDNNDDKQNVFTILSPPKDTVIVRKPIEIKAPSQHSIAKEDKTILQQPIVFEKANTVMSLKTQQHLDKVVELLHKHPTIFYKLLGYQHSGEPAGVSQRRVNLVRQYLIKKGIPNTRIIVDNVPKDDPISIQPVILW